MFNKIATTILLIAFIVIGLKYFWFVDKNLVNESKEPVAENIKVNATIVDYENNLDELLQEKNVMLFFAASWCATCKALKDNIIEDIDLVPDDLYIVMVDFDTERDLRMKYGVTLQHTLVFIDDTKQQVQKKIGVMRVTSLIEDYYKLIEDGVLTSKNKGGSERKEFNFKNEGLNTNTAKKSVDLGLVLNGGPGKDGIPAINNPKFIKISDDADQGGLNDETLGISVKIGTEAKFYPYSILYWHEIANDTIGDTKVSVTFCPLCGTAIVYDRMVDGTELRFGVSGKLYESNLLMYDNLTHTLWSQSIGEAVVGDYLGTKLDILKSDLISYKQFKINYPAGFIMSEDTGYNRSYGRSPYSGYETNDELYFPVKNLDIRLAKKELLFVVPYKGESYAFVRSEVQKKGTVDYKIGDETIKITYKNGEITAKSGKIIIPGYIEMWFSWATQHPGSENIWLGK